MKNLIQYLNDNKLSFKQIDDNFIEINGQKFNLVYPTDDDVIFSKNFELLIEFPCDNYVYEFGGKYYWELSKDVLSPKLNPLKYLGTSTAYIETEYYLGIHGGYEILNGSRLYGDWCKKAKFLGCKVLGICEKNTLAGVLKFQLECHKYKIKPIIGATYTVFRESEDFRYDIKLFVINNFGWQNLLMINKEVLVINNKWVAEDRLLKLLGGLVVVLDPKSLPFEKINKKILDHYGFYQLDTVEFVDDTTDKLYLENVKKYYQAGYRPLPMADAYYLDKEDCEIKPILNSISGVREYKSENQYFKDRADYLDELSTFFDNDSDYLKLVDDLFENEKELCDSCDFQIEIGVRHFPRYKMTEEESQKFETNEDLFWDLIGNGLAGKVPEDKYDQYIERIDEEVRVIKLGNIIDYFLILWDIINYARNNGILVGIGRGSAGGSLVSYLLGIIQLNPIEFDLLFSRFLNEGRVVKSSPDIDTDFPASDRDKIKEYMQERYGINQVCSIGTYTALQIKASIKDLSKQFNVDFGDVNQVTTLIPNMKDFVELFQFSSKNGRVKAFIKSNADVINNVNLVLHQPKAKSVHACAMLILPDEKDMFNWVPITCIDGQMVSEWEGNELEAAGFLKEDILGIRQLDKFQNILELIEQRTGKKIDIYSIPLDDQRVYEYFSKGWNGDTFHFGSQGLTGYCKELLPEGIEDLIAGISLYRPGAMENNFHNEYILRKSGEREVEYFTGADEILGKTYGVFVYQEQIMKLCQVLGGLTMVEADDVRKAMVKKKYDELLKYKDRFIENYISQFKVERSYSENVWDAIDKASTYLFNRSHAAAYAITGYISQWFKVNYPLEYWSVAFKYAEEKDHALYINEINQIGDIKIMPSDINKSRDDVFTDFETKTIYWPLISIKQLGEKAAEQLIKERDDNGIYYSFEEFLDRNKFKGSKVGKSVIENLIMSGAFDNLEGITTNNGRHNLIQKYRRLAKVKVDDEKDIFAINKSLLTQNWWWTLQQKRLSGIAFFDFKPILNQYIEKGKIIKPEDFQRESYSDARMDVKIGGYIVEVEERESKKKGKWCRITIESNYTFINVTIWPDHYKYLQELNLPEKAKCLILINGEIVWDSYKNMNILQSKDDTEVFVLE